MYLWRLEIKRMSERSSAHSGNNLGNNTLWATHVSLASGDVEDVRTKQCNGNWIKIKLRPGSVLVFWTRMRVWRSGDLWTVQYYPLFSCSCYSVTVIQLQSSLPLFSWVLCHQSRSVHVSLEMKVWGDLWSVLPPLFLLILHCVIQLQSSWPLFSWVLLSSLLSTIHIIIKCEVTCGQCSIIPSLPAHVTVIQLQISWPRFSCLYFCQHYTHVSL